MCSQKNQTFYSCGHPRPQGPIRALIAHAKPLLSQSQPEPRQQKQLPHYTSADKAASPLPQTSSYAVIFNNPFNDETTPPPPYTSSSARAARHNSYTKVPSSSSASSTLKRELTPEERVAVGMEYMYAFLASRSRSPSATSSRGSSTSPVPEKQTGRRAAIV
jgi:hypothetical protein